MIKFYIIMFRHALNPTSSFRMQLILKNAFAKLEKEKLKSMKVVDDDDDGSLLSGLMSLSLGESAEKNNPVPCQCTRKCKTKACTCFKARRSCHSLCHIGNRTCTNV